MSELIKYAQDAVAAFPDSEIETGFAFLEKAEPEFLGECNDRLVKVGRMVTSLVRDNHPSIEPALELLLQECRLLLQSSPAIQVPTVRFGKTGLQMPIVTLGCMRFQQEWGPRISQMNQVGSDCQDNLVAILKRAIDYGMYHIETARGYGCSELQLGVALKQLFRTNYVKREDLIIQTKIPASEDPAVFRAAMELSLKNLQLTYVDLFAFHGMNYEEQFSWVFEGQNNCLSVVKDYMAAGKIKHLGFSTHGSTDFIIKCIKTDVFDYVNLHYHYFGSYTASGCGHDGNGNLDAVKLLEQKDIGRFIISPFDKGGRLYAPSKKLRSLTLPEMEPMTFKSLWLWNHHKIYEGAPHLHTYTVGAARPSDLDQPAVAACLHATQNADVLAKVKATTARLESVKKDELGAEWVATWWKGLPKATGSKHWIEHNQIVWIYNSIKAFGMYEFAKSRYNSFEKNNEKWDDSKTEEENIAAIGKNAWGFVPGLSLKPDVDYFMDDLVNVPEENKERVKEAEAFVYKWCRDRSYEKETAKAQKKSTDTTTKEGSNEKCDIMPAEWETSFDMRPWPDYPDQPSRA